MSVSTDIPLHRRDGLERVLAALEQARTVAITTHINADGDGAGSAIALASWLTARGKIARVTCPTPFPRSFRFLVEDDALIADPGTPAARAVLAEADLLAVLDTGEADRIGRIARALRDRTVVVIDHHPVTDQAIDASAELRDATAAAAGELIYDLFAFSSAREPRTAWPQAAVEAIYTALITDTGSFRFSNTTPRVHALAGDLLERGVDPERMYRLIYGSVPLHRIRLLERALTGLEVDPALPLSWITIPVGSIEELGASGEDIDGLVDYARTVEGTEVAVLLRQLPDGATKVSWRSNGDVVVNAIAREFGGGGHVKAAGALIGEPMEKARPRVLEATRAAIRRVVDPAPRS